MRFKVIISICLFIDTLLTGQGGLTVPEIITEKFNNYCLNFPREEVYVHTDRSVYVAGEEMWMSVYQFDRGSQRLNSASKIVYIELLNGANRPVLQKRVGTDGGTGSGKVILPDTVRTGRYTLRAYTNLMKNFMPENCFSQKITILNKQGVNGFILPAGGSNGHVKVEEEEMPVRLDIKKGTTEGKIITEIITSEEFRMQNGNTCYLFVETHGVINHKKEIRLTGERTLAEISSDDLLPGINHYTIFDTKGKPVTERYHFNRGAEKVLADVSIMSGDSCRPRGKVELGINFSSTSADAGGAEISVSVVPAGTWSGPSLSDYMVFGSEFGEIPEEMQRAGSLTDSVINNFLTTVNSKWIVWENILSDKYPEIRYEREERHHFIYYTDLDRQQDTADQKWLFLSVPGKETSFQYAVKGPGGDYVFSMPPDTCTRGIIVQPEREGDVFAPVSSYSDKYSTNNTIATPAKLPDTLFRKLEVNARIMSVYNSYKTSPKKRSPLTTSEKSFYGVPDVSVKMDDYISFPTMQEVFFEIIPGVAMKTENAGYQISVRDPVSKMKYDNPMLFIDGAFVRDPAVIAGIDPTLVEKIDVVLSKYYVGDYLMTGIISVITNSGSLKGIILPPGANRIQYRALEPADEFRFNDYTQPGLRESRLPDFRNTMYWKRLSLPSSEKSVKMEFSASDFETDYDIIVEGVTGNGKVVSRRGRIVVGR